MKVFVYNKSNSNKIAVIEKVIEVKHLGDQILVITEVATFGFNTHEVKTTIYQN